MTKLSNDTSRLFWLDLEMTGLDPERDVILEAAAIVTDWDFRELGSFESGIRQNKSQMEALLTKNEFARSRPEETRKLVEVSANGRPEREVETELLQLIDRHFPANEPVLLAGNSIRMDRMFIAQYWPRLEARLHYRMLDVSAWKVVAMGRYGLEFKKKEAHRALDDIRESIAELQYYLQYFRVNS